MTETNLHVGYCAEILGPDGPTGDLVEVLEVAVLDYGGNEYWRGPVADAATQQKALRIHTRLRVIRTGVICSSADVCLDCYAE